MAAAPELPDLDQVAFELIQLEHRAADVQRRHERIIDRLAAFPNDVTVARERELALQLDAMTARITRLKAQLVPLRRVT